jgi:hypothetical protein
MPRVIWSNTSHTTNPAESAHALSQRYGTQLTLVAAVQQGKKIDEQYFMVQRAVRDSGIQRGYANRSISGREKKNMARRAVRARQKRSRQEEMIEVSEVEEV